MTFWHNLPPLHILRLAPPSSLLDPCNLLSKIPPSTPSSIYSLVASSYVGTLSSSLSWGKYSATLYAGGGVTTCPSPVWLPLVAPATLTVKTASDFSLQQLLEWLKVANVIMVALDAVTLSLTSRQHRSQHLFKQAIANRAITKAIKTRGLEAKRRWQN